EGREIVVEDEFAVVGGGGAFNQQLIIRCTEGHGGEGLCFTAGEQGGAVRRRQQVHFHVQGAHLVQHAAIEADALVQDHVAHGLFFQVVEIFTYQRSVFFGEFT